MNIVVGFDTSCYTTSVAAADERGRIIGSCRKLLPVPIGQRGLRQSEAVFAHTRQIPQMAEALAETLAKENHRICAVAASSTPISTEDSYMPVFVAGLSYARTLAAMLKVPCYAFSHQQGHIAAGQIGGVEMSSRFIALHLSGGTTDMLLSEDGRLTSIGGSLDLHAGQLVDRVGVAMGCSFPAGPALEKLALACGEKPRALLPVSMAGEDLHCHLSGAEAQCVRLLQKNELSKEEIALEVFDFLARTISRLLLAGSKRENSRQALVVGGVASSALLRNMVEARVQKVGSPLKVIFGKPEYSADNAAGIALLGTRKHFALSESVEGE